MKACRAFEVSLNGRRSHSVASGPKTGAASHKLGKRKHRAHDRGSAHCAGATRVQVAASTATPEFEFMTAN